ncbi:hypothetical protein OF83DRAFT_1155327 [Amylostereum chailletii]|nr:hypothetical protein OF83DRAFT_1155327 [Amylostereum chailletii]
MAQHGMARQSQNMMYPNPGENNELNGNPNGHHMQASGPLQSEELYKRSVTLIIWYKAHTTPLRFPHPVPGFPFMQLSQFSSLVSSLSLDDSSFVDTYNPVTGEWEQHGIDTIRRVESEQRVLYRLRKNLFEWLEEDDCLGLQDELAAQPQPEPQPRHNRLKRPAPEMVNDTSPPSKYFISDNPMYSDSPHHSPAQSYPVPSYPGSSMSTKTNGHGQQPVAIANSPPHTSHVAGPSSNPLKQSYNMYPNPMYSVPVHSPPSTPASSSASAPPSSTAQTSVMHSAPSTPTPQPSSVSAPIPYHPHPPLKRWPNDYTVSEIADGFKQMDDLVGQMPTMTQRTAFERVFGCRYVKSTVCRHRGVWRRADDGVRNVFIAMGRDERAMWGEFVRRVEGRTSGLHGGGVGSIGIGADVNGGSVGVMQVQVPQMSGLSIPVQVHGEIDDTGQDAVMGSLGPPPQNDPHHVGENAHSHGMVQVMGMNGQTGPGQQGDGMVHMFSASTVRTADERVGVYNASQLLGGDQ